MSNDVHDIDIDIDSLAPRFVDVLQTIKNEEPISQGALADELNVDISTVYSKVSRIRSKVNDSTVIKDTQQGYRLNKKYSDIIPEHEDEEDNELGELNDREEYILKSLPLTTSELEEDLGVSEPVVKAHMQSISDKNYDIEYDETTETWYSDDSHQIRSSEAIGTRTRKANEWWQKRHDELVRDFRALPTPSAKPVCEKGNQDIVSHLTDIHMGDLNHDDNGDVIYDMDIAQKVIRYITRKQLELYRRQSQQIEFDTWHELWGGDFVTGEGIYEGQHEDLDGYLDEQHDMLFEPLFERIKKLSQEMKVVNIVCKTGNHGEQRASGKSKQANSDLILYKHIRNTISVLQREADMLQNVNFQIGASKAYKRFTIRNKFNGLLLHGQDRKAGYRTSSEQSDWARTALNTDFDFAYAGHIHRDINFSVEDRKVIFTGSPKPSGDFARRISALSNYDVGTLHGVSDQGITFSYDIDCRDFEP